MPRVKKSQQQQPIIEDFPDPVDLIADFNEEPAELARPSRKKNRNAHNKTLRVESSSPELALDNLPAASEPPLSPRPPHSLLSQITFSTHTKSKPVDIREDVAAIEKVSDQYTPPSDAGIPDHLYGKSPNSVAVSSPANTPPVEPGFSARGSFKARSPPISPPQRSARPVSFGATIPPLPHYARYPLSNYGAPPAPHLPQPHFYGAADVELGIPKIGQKSGPQDSTFTKFIRLPNVGVARKHGIISGSDGKLQISSFDGNLVEEVGTLCDLSGTVVDAEMLQWTSGSDPFAELRPILAVTLMHFEQAEGGIPQYRESVSLHSLSHQQLLLDILFTLPHTLQPVVSAQFATTPHPCSHLKLAAAGNYLTISSTSSGELFVFTPTVQESNATLECVGKFWTGIQPREQPKSSSQNRLGHVDVPYLTSSRIRTDDNVPIFTLSGRWLAICPPSSPSLKSAGIVLGDNIVAGRQAGLEALSAGTRPAVNCEVDSPDADTLLGKVARGVAQEMMKAGKWLGEQGMQAWQNYWKKDDPSSQSLTHTAYQQPPPPPHQQIAFGQFPPTHADAKPAAKDPDLISIFDLKALQDPSSRKSVVIAPVATFQPPHGCSFLSFSPHGLMLLSASRKGDYQYIWDLLEVKHVRAVSSESESPAIRSTSRVRQLARFDRLSGSVIVDVVWEVPTMLRLALLTKNKTIHLFDLPASAQRWPPPRRSRKSRPISAPSNATPTVENDASPAGGFFASAMNFAGKTQPVLANLRGRAPSTSGGLAGIGQAGFGIATATGAKGSKVVATGLSKSLGAATDTMIRMQHAGDNRLHLKSEKEALAGHVIWVRRVSKPGLVVLGETGLKLYQVRKSKARDARQRDTTIFDARRAVSFKIPDMPTEFDTERRPGLWKVSTDQNSNPANVHPLSFAEIDTNAAFQPFHSDRRVTLSIFDSEKLATQQQSSSKKSKSASSQIWIFGDEIPTERLNVNVTPDRDDEEPGSVIYRETTLSNTQAGEGEQIVSTTRRKKPKRAASAHNHATAGHEDFQQEGFFEDDCDVLDFASDRV